MLRRVLLAVAAGAAVLALGAWSPAPAAGAGVDTAGRPSLPWAYSRPSVAAACRNPGPLHTETADGVVVHYARTGPDAVPPADRDRSGVPDYVECVAAAASRALQIYGNVGLRRPLRDRVGRAVPDVYLVARPPGGALGLVSADRRGDLYVRLSTRMGRPGLPPVLDTPDAVLLPKSLWHITSHEMFHLVQGAYMPLGRIPGWIREGSADWFMLGAMYDRLGTRDFLASSDQWARASWLPLTADPRCSDRCYGGVAFWLAFDDAHSRGTAGAPWRLLFERLRDAHRAGRPIGTGAAIVDGVIRDQDNSSIGAVMVRMLDVFGLAWKIPPFPLADALPAATPADATFANTAAPLSAPRIPLPADGTAADRTMRIVVRTSSPLLYPVVYLRRPSLIVPLTGRDEAQGTWTYAVPATFGAAECAPAAAPCARQDVSVLMLNTTNRPADYTVTYRLEAAP